MGITIAKIGDISAFLVIFTQFTIMVQIILDIIEQWLLLHLLL